MRRFVLVRGRDMSKVSGEGVIVWGVQYPDGYVAYRWNTATATTSLAESIEDVEAIHGHGGATRLVWLDTPEGAELWRLVPEEPVSVVRIASTGPAAGGGR